MKRVLPTALALVLLSLAAPDVASAKTTQTASTAETHSTSGSPQSPYVDYCLTAINDAIGDAGVDAILKKVLHLPKAAKAYEIYTTGPDIAMLKYQLGHGQIVSAEFSASRVFYDVLSLIPGTSGFWSIGPPATSCLEAAFVWAHETSQKIGRRLRKNLTQFLPWLVTPPSSAPCTPSITAVGSFNATATQTVEITGSCFGTGNTSAGSDTDYFRISDLTGGWNACWTGDPGTDSVTCNVSSWTDTAITFSGYTGGYGQGTWVVNIGDRIEIRVWNPQSGRGPATFEVTASDGAMCCVT